MPALLLALGDGCGRTCVSPPEMDGRLVIAEVPSAAYDRARWSAEHKQDVDLEEDGCLHGVEVVFSQGAGEGCGMTVRASVQGEDVVVYSVNVEAGSDCLDFPDEREGSYMLSAESAPVTIAGLPAAVPDDNADRSCFEAEVTFDGVATLAPAGLTEPTLTVDFGDVALRGGLASRGSEVASCQEP